MDRELVLVVLALLFAGPLFATCGAVVPSRTTRSPSAQRWEQRCWARLWLPLLPGGFVLAVLVGWALMEPASAEPVPRTMVGAAMPFVPIWCRALARAVRSALARPPGVAAGTVGLVRPRVVISERFSRALTARERDATRAHEIAHVRHRDPLRLLLAQLATDLQWPCPGAQARLDQWRRSLELARDEEARLQGADGWDLAAAILAAARLGPHWRAGSTALVGGGVPLEERIGALLAPLPRDDTPVAPSPVLLLSLTAAGMGAVCLGATLGETVVRALVA